MNFFIISLVFVFFSSLVKLIVEFDWFIKYEKNENYYNSDGGGICDVFFVYIFFWW